MIFRELNGLGEHTMAWDEVFVACRTDNSFYLNLFGILSGTEGEDNEVRQKPVQVC
jgi:hypothetical protein